MEFIMRLVYVIIIFSSVFASTIGLAQNVKITGLGASKCEKYIDDTNANENAEKTYFAWAQGFMNGALVRAPAGVDDNLDLLPPNFPVAAQMSYLKNWCGRNRDADFSDASFALFKELRGKLPK